MNNTKLKAPLIGANGNIFNLISITARVLKRNGLKNLADEMSNRVMASHSYDEALSIITEYVEPVAIDEYEEA